MRAAVLALALASLPASAQVTFQKWQDMGQYVGQQTVKLNAHTDQLAALTEKVAALAAAKADADAKLATLTTDMGLVIGRYDALLRAIVINVCASNKLMTDNQWASTLIGIKPIPLPGHECPADPVTARYYVPGYLGADGPPIPPAQ